MKRKKKMKIVQAIEEIPDGKIYNLCTTESNTDWIRAVRLKDQP